MMRLNRVSLVWFADSTPKKRPTNAPVHTALPVSVLSSYLRQQPLRGTPQLCITNMLQIVFSQATPMGNAHSVELLYNKAKVAKMLPATVSFAQFCDALLPLTPLFLTVNKVRPEDVRLLRYSLEKNTDHEKDLLSRLEVSWRDGLTREVLSELLGSLMAESPSSSTKEDSVWCTLLQLLPTYYVPVHEVQNKLYAAASSLPNCIQWSDLSSDPCSKAMEFSADKKAMRLLDRSRLSSETNCGAGVLEHFYGSGNQRYELTPGEMNGAIELVARVLPSYWVPLTTVAWQYTNFLDSLERSTAGKDVTLLSVARRWFPTIETLLDRRDLSFTMEKVTEAGSDARFTRVRMSPNFSHPHRGESDPVYYTSGLGEPSCTAESPTEARWAYTGGYQVRVVSEKAEWKGLLDDPSTGDSFACAMTLDDKGELLLALTSLTHPKVPDVVPSVYVCSMEQCDVAQLPIAVCVVDTDTSALANSRQNKLDEALNALPHCPVTTLPLLLNYAGYPWPYREDVVTKVGGAYVTVKHAIRAHYPSTDATSFRRAVEGVLAVSVLQERLRDSEGSQASFRQLKHFVELNRHNPLSQRHHSLTRRLSKYLRTIKGVPMEDWSPEAGDTPAEEPTDFCALVKSPERLDALSLASKEKLLKHLEMTLGPDAWSSTSGVVLSAAATQSAHTTAPEVPPTAPATKEPKEEEEELPLEMVMPAADPPTPPAPPAPKPTIEEDLPDVFNQLLDDFKENQSATAARNQAKSPRRTSSTVSGFGIPRAEETPSEPAKRPPTPTNTGEQTGNKITGGLFSFTPADGGESYKRTERLPSSSFKGKTDGYAKRPVTYNNTLKSGFGGQFDVPPPTGFGRKTLTSITSNYGENPIGGLASDIIAASTSQRKTASQSWKNNDNVSTEALRLLLNSEAGKALLRGIINE